MSTIVPFVLGFAADTDLCGMQRVLLPMAAAHREGMLEGRVDTEVWPIDALKATAPDVIVWQRQFSDEHLEAMRVAREALPETWFVYEIDDLLSRVPPEKESYGAFPDDIEKRIYRALSYCDAASTTTPHLAGWLRSLGTRRVSVIQNLVPRESILLDRPKSTSDRVRVGWTGSAADLADVSLLNPAMQEIGDKVDWVFFGACPVRKGISIEHHEMVPAAEYMAKLQSLNLDLLLAPLEPNAFNRAKSNQRLVDAGAAHIAAIAQDTDSLRAGGPPVWAYCTSPGEWTQEIKRFVRSSRSRRQGAGTSMMQWVAKECTYETQMRRRVSAWVPAAKLFTPKRVKTVGAALVASNGAELLRKCETSRNSGQPVLWLRPGTTLSDGGKALMRAALSGQVAATMPLATDGLNALPRAEMFTSVGPDLAQRIDLAVSDVNAGRLMRVPVTFGPAVLLRSEAIGLLGAPDVTGCGGNVDAALMEWSSRASLRGLHCIQVASAFAGCTTPPDPVDEKVRLRMEGRNTLQAVQNPSESLTRADREAIELGYFRKHWLGLQPGMGGFGSDDVTKAALAKPEVTTERRVLVINDRVGLVEGELRGTAVERHQAGEIVFMADINGFDCALTVPTPATPIIWDVRDTKRFARSISYLGIDEIVLCGLVGSHAPAAVETLRCLTSLATKLTYAPSNAESVCPRLNLTADGQLCGDGYQEGWQRCQGCVDQHGSPFGRVLVPAYWQAWDELLQRAA